MISASRIPKTRASTFGGRRPLQQRAPGDVEQAAGGAGDREQEQRPDGLRPHRHHGERDGPDAERGDDRRHQPGPPDERRGDRDPERAAGAEGRVEVAGATLAHPERVDREHDVEHVEHPDRDVLRAEQADEQPRLRLVAQHLEALEELRRRCRSPRPALAAGGPLIGRTRTAATRTSAPISRKTQPGPHVAISSPATAGATSTLTLSIQPEITLAAVSSSGARASAGVSVATVGRVTTTAVAATAAARVREPRRPVRGSGPPRSRPCAIPCAT